MAGERAGSELTGNSDIREVGIAPGIAVTIGRVQERAVGTVVEMVRAGHELGAMYVRPAGLEDLQPVVEILRGAPEPRKVDEIGLAASFSAPPNEDGTGEWVVTEGGIVIGYVALGLPQDDVPSLELSVYLAPPAVGEGRGRRLTTEFATLAAVEGGAALLTATPDTAAAVRMLTVCGFRVRASYTPEPTDDPVATKLHSTQVRVSVPWDLEL